MPKRNTSVVQAALHRSMFRSDLPGSWRRRLNVLSRLLFHSVCATGAGAACVRLCRGAPQLLSCPLKRDGYARCVVLRWVVGTSVLRPSFTSNCRVRGRFFAAAPGQKSPANPMAAKHPY